MGTTTTLRRGFIAILLATAIGCSRDGGPIRETEQYSFDDVATQLAAEEAASVAARER